MKGIQGKVALVTGSSRGIGRAIALRLAAEGADVVVHYNRTPEGARDVAAAIVAAGRRTHVVQADVARVAEVRRMLAEAVEQLGRVDLLVNNAGVEVNAPFGEVTEEDFDRVLDVDLKGVFFASQALVRHLQETRRPGKIINISSVHEDLPFPHFASYCAAKGGVRMLTRTLAVELKGMGITVNAIAPGAIETEINRDLLRDPAKLRPLRAKIPLGRIGTPDDVAGVAAFLASADADYVTGATYFIDGGLAIYYEEQ